jgi:23S rRNA (cytosine1962-C5)-methyltransferase
MTNFDLFPQVSNKRIAIHVKPAAERMLRACHPWVFDNSIRKQSHEGSAGDLAVIFDSKRRFLAVGLYDPHSPIRVKVLQHRQQATIDAAWFTERLQAAIALRQPLVSAKTNGYRLLHGENDGFPGLIIDVYAATLVMKLYSAAWLPHLKDIITALQTLHAFDRLLLRLSRNIQGIMAQYGLNDGQALVGAEITETVVFQENGLSFAADVVHGHKTGFFFDQRDNRSEVRKLSTGRRVLDVFAYSGGFSLYAAAGGARSVTSLDISAPALAAAKGNFALNQDDGNVKSSQHITMVDDAFAGIESLRAEGRSFDMVIVDPPSFAKSAAEVERALLSYTRLTRLALTVLDSDGVFVMASCSSRVTTSNFFNNVFSAVNDAGRSLTEIKRTSHALDHPIGFPEGEYLKCLFAIV